MGTLFEVLRIPIFEILVLSRCLCCISEWSDWTTFYAEKIGLSLSQLVPEILGAKVSQMFHQNVSPKWSDWTTVYAEKIGLSLSHLVPEILGAKVSQMFHQSVLFNSV